MLFALSSWLIGTSHMQCIVRMVYVHCTRGIVVIKSRYIPLENYWWLIRPSHLMLKNSIHTCVHTHTFTLSLSRTHIPPPPPPHTHLYLWSLAHSRSILWSLKVEHSKLIAERVKHAKLHNLNDVPGISLRSLLPQLRPSTGLRQSNKRLQLSGSDGRGVLTLAILTKL